MTLCAFKQLPVPQQLACTEFSNCSSFGSDGAFVPDAVALACAHPLITARGKSRTRERRHGVYWRQRLHCHGPQPPGLLLVFAQPAGVL